MTSGKCQNCGIRSKAASTLSSEELDYLNDNCAEIILSPGEKIIREGQVSTHVAYIKSGLAKIHKLGPNGHDQIMKIVMPGTYIGIHTILSERLHRYSASVLEESRICYIDNRSFRELITRNPNFASEIILYLCQDELSYFERFINLAQKQVNGRLAEVMLYFSSEVYKNEKFVMPLLRSDLAALIGMTRESVSRALKEMKDAGIVKFSAREMEILDKERLIRISRSG